MSDVRVTIIFHHDRNFTFCSFWTRTCLILFKTLTPNDSMDVDEFEVLPCIILTCTLASLSRNASNPKIKGAVIFHEQGPQLFDYSIRLNHSWAFSGFPDVKTIMDTNGPYLNDLELGFDTVPTLQYGLSGFLTV